LQIDPETSARLLPLIPRGVVAIAESGVRSIADVARAASAGAEGVLVGSELSKSAEPEKAVRSLIDVPRMVDARKG
jgi:indole-3-glycerol phosphate synthase